jgi:uncharacterized protein with GYD domain
MAWDRSPNRERRNAMPVYVSLVKFTREGIMTMKDQGITRSDAVKKNIEELGGRLIDAYYCLGQYDVVAILEFPDNKTAMKAAVRNASIGHIEITTMPAIPRDEWANLLREVWKTGKKR